MYNTFGVSSVLKIALFATGCAGIVAEFVLSTLATYLMGNAIFQWTIVMSLMLFAMGVGSRFSRLFHVNLLDSFILIEFCLSILCAASAQVAYGIAAHSAYTGLILYSMAVVIGCLIGLEIPLVTRINEAYEELRTNISEVMEKDYYGSLAGGLAFAFFFLPYLGLTYTPIVLGTINFLVAALLMWRFFFLLKKKRMVTIVFSMTFVFMIGLAVLARPLIRYGEQAKYRDKVIYAGQTPYQKIVMTQWKQYYWLYINGQEQFSTFDEEKYHEPLVHPAIKLSHNPEQVLILGGGDGLALREVLKHKSVRSVTLVDLDPSMTGLAKTHPILTAINQGAMNSPKLKLLHDDAAKFLESDDNLYGVIILDLPDPDTIDLMHVYSLKFYAMVKKHLIRGGIMVCQGSSPYFSKKAFLCVLKTIRAVGFSAIPYHNQIPTMGEWGWVIAADEKDISEPILRKLALEKQFSDIDTRFLNQDAMVSMFHFGKGILDEPKEGIRTNTELNPVLYQYYSSGAWGMY